MLHQKLNSSFVLMAMATFVCLSTRLAVGLQLDKKQQNEEGKQIQVSIAFAKSEVNVKIGDDLFTTFVFGKYDKPIFYPVFGPNQIGMTRNWPMKDGEPGESHDHPHHKSIWFSHEINGIDFWSEQEGAVSTSIVDPQSGERNSFLTRSDWIRKDNGNTVLTDETKFQFGFDETARWIDAQINFQATHGEVSFDDTKEGTFAVRTHPDLRLTSAPRNGVHDVHGRALNSNGESGQAIWGKAAKWVLYNGPVEGIPMSIAIFDHPNNLRHPTTWHARDYGLVAANPFGLHYFQGVVEGAGAYTLEQGKELQLRYRIVFIRGNATAEEVNERFNAFADTLQIK